MRSRRRRRTFRWVGLCVTVGFGAAAAPALANELAGRDGADTRFFVDGSKVRVTVAKPLVRRRAMRLTCVELVGTGMSSSYAEFVTRRFVGHPRRRRWTLRFSRDASRLINRCGLATGTREIDLTGSANGSVMRRLSGPVPGCRTGRREDLVTATTAVKVTQVQHLVLRVCRRTDARPTDVDGFYQDGSRLHRWTNPTAIADTVAWVAVDDAQGNDSLSVRGQIAGAPAVHRIDPSQLGSSTQRTYMVLQLTCTAAGSYALLVHDDIAGRDVLYAGRLATDAGATTDTQPSGAIAGVSVDDDTVSWTAGGQQHAAALP
jgi:hypothetical protein